ncbi:YceD family protein [Polymorphobacter sp.]|uniref:YceD family protein n=1 Tax=Polymorphobacter sp. TaxID=1909290 RepID=UPI003F716147
MTSAPPPEFSRPIRAHEVGGRPRRHPLSASPAERTALASRFDLLALDRLDAVIDVVRAADGIRLSGQIDASGAQPCVATGTPVPFTLQAPIALLLTESSEEAEDLELRADDLDVERLAGDEIDLGEWAAQALALALDPYPRSPQPAPGVISEEDAVAVRSPFAVLKGKAGE